MCYSGGSGEGIAGAALQRNTRTASAGSSSIASHAKATGQPTSAKIRGAIGYSPLSLLMMTTRSQPRQPPKGTPAVHALHDEEAAMPGRDQRTKPRLKGGVLSTRFTGNCFISASPPLELSICASPMRAFSRAERVSGSSRLWRCSPLQPSRCNHRDTVPDSVGRAPVHCRTKKSTMRTPCLSQNSR